MSPARTAADAPRRVRTLWVDLGNVLVTFDHMTTCRALGRRAGLEASEVHARIFGSGLERDLDLGRISPEEFASRVARTLDAPRLAAGDVLRDWCDIFTRHEANLALLESLAARFRLLLTSNTNAPHFTHCARLCPELAHFHGEVLSYREGARKPDESYYRRALERSGREPRECLLVDDSPANLEGAGRLGVRVLLHPPGGDLAAGLRAEGLLEGAGVPGGPADPGA